MTLAINDDTDKEEVTRLIQWGVRFPDGTIKWAMRDPITGSQKIGYGSRDYLIEPTRDGRGGYINFDTLEADYLRKLKDSHLPDDESSLLTRVRREVIVLFGRVEVPR